MLPPPLPLFSPSPKAPPPPPWLHGSSTQTRDSAPPVPPPPAEAAPLKPRTHSPKPAPARKNTKTTAKPLTAGVPGGRTHRAVLGIIRRVRSLELSDAPSASSVHASNAGAAAAAAAFHLPIEPSPPREPGQEVVGKAKPRAVPWAAARDEGLKVALRREKKPREPTRAETELETHELDRLRRLARGMGRWARAKKAGVTDEVVEEMRREWASGEELAAVRIVEPLRRSMDRAREILEIKTGGLVVWTKGDIHFVYRGSKYQQNTKHSHTSLTNVHKGSLVKHNVRTTLLKCGSEGPALINSYGEADDAFQENDQSICDQKDEEPVKGTLYEREVNRLLDTLGPRFVDWWWDTPLPVDADLLPEFVPGFKTPFRQCPPCVRPTLADEELTYLRKLARPLPTHFALGNTPSGGVALPFILVQTRPHATVEVEISEDMQLVHFDFNSTPFELHDDSYVLKEIRFCGREQHDGAQESTSNGAESSSMSNIYWQQVQHLERPNNGTVRLPSSPPIPGILKGRVKHEH